ncbi:chemotaxis protein CheX [Clostridium sp. BNL1100]|uniref:chemotaxis protein CheX n=1 Tax=Clostridium sp. BNL1100 TaxID=755731 RepID=UPI00024A7520|nr:chemotaxis protein CheX [Clostridium sp. BNL1100]AEY66883.1 putative inhibitor of MCP methylation, CheC [Clostridium sp. BNL1100]
MNIEYINPFIEASQTVLKQVVNVDARLGKVFLKNSPYQGESILIIVGITGKIRGQAIFTMSKDVAFKIASAMMMGMPVDELNEISKSALSELTNMILGNTATLLYNKGIGIEITPPSLLLGENLQISQSKMKTICIPLYLSDNEILEIDISVQD